MGQPGPRAPTASKNPLAQPSACKPVARSTSGHARAKPKAKHTKNKSCIARSRRPSRGSGFDELTFCSLLRPAGAPRRAQPTGAPYLLFALPPARRATKPSTSPPLLYRGSGCSTFLLSALLPERRNKTDHKQHTNLPTTRGPQELEEDEPAEEEAPVSLVAVPAFIRQQSRHLVLNRLSSGMAFASS